MCADHWNWLSNVTDFQQYYIKIDIVVMAAINDQLLMAMCVILFCISKNVFLMI